MKDEGSVGHSTVTKWFKKFHLSDKYLDDQVCLKLFILRLLE